MLLTTQALTRPLRQVQVHRGVQVSLQNQTDLEQPHNQQQRVGFDVLNPGGSDVAQDFSKRLDPAALEHPPVNYHAYAACMKGRFVRRIADVQGEVVLLLLRGDLSHTLRAGKQCSSLGIPFLISWKESGYHQVAQSLSHTYIFQRFMEISRMATGFLASTPWLLSIYHAAQLTLGRFIPTPYPVDIKEWDFSVPIIERSGIFLGTREFFVPSRNHAVAILTACELAFQLGIHVTCINTDGRRGNALLRSIDARRGVLQVVQGCLAYKDYLQLIARHQIVLQFDRSSVPGQVAGDAALCGVPALGGDGALDNILSSVYQVKGSDFEEVISYAGRLLNDCSLYAQVVEALHQRALETISFYRASEALQKLAKEAIQQRL